MKYNTVFFDNIETKNEVTIQVNYDWFISLNLYAGSPQKTHQSYHQAPLGEFRETYYAFSTKEIIFKSKKTKEKDKKTGILKNAVLKIICFSF